MRPSSRSQSAATTALRKVHSELFIVKRNPTLVDWGAAHPLPQDWSSLHAGTPSGGRVGLRLELAWLDRAETPC